MQSRPAELTPRAFNPMSVPGLSYEGREAVNGALKAMSNWRNEMAEASEKGSRQVMEKMAAAAAALGWPEQIVNAARAQMQSINEMQIKTIDQIMDAWEEQLKLPNPTSVSPSSMLSKLKSVPGFGPTGSWSGGDAFRAAAMNPFQMWTQVAEQWQKSWVDTMTLWTNSTSGKVH